MRCSGFYLPTVFMTGTWLAALSAQAAPCLLVTLTGTMSGPVLLNGVAGAGTLMRYGDNCSAVNCSLIQGAARR
jgi:ribonuclease Z